MKNVKRDKNSPVEKIEGRLKRLRMNGIDARKRLRLREEKGGRARKQRYLEGRTNEYLEEKTPVEIIEERKQRLRTSRKDTRLRTPVPRGRRVGGWEKKTAEDGKTTSLKKLRIDLAKMKRLEST